MTRLTDWQQEFKRWAPDLNVVMYVGNRESREIIRRTEFYTPPLGNQRPQLKFNVLLTTYEMVLKDEEELGYAALARDRMARLVELTSVRRLVSSWRTSTDSAIRWYSMVVDEAHRLKNVESQLHDALRVRSRGASFHWHG